MIQSFEAMAEAIRKSGAQKLSVAVAQDDDVLLAVHHAAEAGIADPILVGDREKILEVAAHCGVPAEKYEIVDVKDVTEASAEAVRLIREGKAAALMKGMVPTATILKAVLNKETGIRSGKTISHLSAFYWEKQKRFIFLTDVAICIAPDLEQKQALIENAVDALHLLGFEKPLVGCVCAVENENPLMPATVDAVELQRRSEAGLISGCVVGGPFALDNAVSVEEAQHKGITGPVAGKADLLLLPDIEAGNIFYKSFTMIAEWEGAGVVLGAKAPMILTSRSDSDNTKFQSICMALYMAMQKNKNN